MAHMNQNDHLLWKTVGIYICMFLWGNLDIIAAARTRQRSNMVLLDQGMHSVIVNYPRSIYEIEMNWKEASHYNESLASMPAQNYENLSRAQDLEDVMLYENWFYGINRGIIIESGALDGWSLSNSLMFEQFADWTAINIEANPPSFHKLKLNRGNAINVFAALCSDEKILHYIDLNAQNVRGFVEFMSENFLKKYHPSYYYNRSSIEDFATMRCLKFTTLWRMLELKAVDIWILDVEGAELSVLQGTNFNVVRVSVIVIEKDLWSEDTNRKCISHLEKYQYTCYEVVRNYFCKHASFRPSTKPHAAVDKAITRRRRLNWWWDQETNRWVDLTPQLTEQVTAAVL